MDGTGGGMNNVGLGGTSEGTKSVAVAVAVDGTAVATGSGIYGVAVKVGGGAGVVGAFEGAASGVGLALGDTNGKD